MHIERELFKLGATHQPVFPERAEQQAAGFGTGDKAGVAQAALDQRLQIRFRVGLALDRRALLGALDQLAQRRVAPQRASGQHDRAMRRRRADKRRQRRNDRFAAGLDEDGAPSAKERRGVGLVEQRKRVGSDAVAAHLDELEGIAAIVDAFLDERERALAHHARVGAEDQEKKDALGRRGDEAFGVATLDRRHEALSVRLRRQ